MAASRAMTRELGDLFSEIIGKLLEACEDLRGEHDPGELDRDLRYDRDVEDPAPARSVPAGRCPGPLIPPTVLHCSTHSYIPPAPYK